MEYKIGDKVILKSDLKTSGWWSQLKTEYDNLDPKIVTVKDINEPGCYLFEEIMATWSEYEIAGIYVEPETITITITGRFEILDL